MTLPEHIVHGAVTHGVLFNLAGQSTWKGVLTGIVFAAMPDLLPKVVAWFGWDEWKAKIETHVGMTALIFSIVPGYWEHVVVDIIFHNAGENSYKKLWYLVLLVDGLFVTFGVWWWVL